MTPVELTDIAIRYTSAWNSQDLVAIVSHYAADGSFSINGAEPVVGHAALTELFNSYFVALPDGVLAMDLVRGAGDKAMYAWTYQSTNTGPGGTGNRVRFSGWEAWTFDVSGMVKQSIGTFDAAEYERQLAEGV